MGGEKLVTMAIPARVAMLTCVIQPRQTDAVAVTELT